MLISDKIRDWLRGHGTTFREVHHEPTRTSEESARARGEELRVGGKALLLKVDADFRLFVLSADRKLERELIAAYETDVASVLAALSPVTLETAVELLSLPDRIRGYGPVKEKAAADAKARHGQLVADLVSPPSAPRQIAAE